MIKRVHDANLAKIRGGDRQKPVCICGKVCACEPIPGDDAASYVIDTNKGRSLATQSPGHK